MLKIIREQLLNEARNSPRLLSDLAGLEQYIAESYNSRSFIELLQNADDAGARRFIIVRDGQFLLIANDGRPFTQEDLESLCRSASSSKIRGANIGYRGIGFKSVAGFAEKIHLISGQTEATFSRKRTAMELPEVARVPLIRIPHDLLNEDRMQFEKPVAVLKEEGFDTIFIFTDLIVSSIESEFSLLDETSLLFLKNIVQMDLRMDTNTTITARREHNDNRTQTICLTGSTGATAWTILEQDGVSLAFIHGENGITRLNEQEAVVHAFLPTYEATGLAVKINGDFSTDPSRTRIVFDERTTKITEYAAKSVIDIIYGALNKTDEKLDARFLTALIPFVDPKITRLQRRSFKTIFLSTIEHNAKGIFNDLRCRPTWLNVVDYDQLTESLGIRSVPRKFDATEGLEVFLRFLGAKNATFEELSPGIEHVTLTLAGAAEIIAYIVKLNMTNNIEADVIKPKWRVWPVNGVLHCLDEVKEISATLDRNFVDLIAEKVGSNSPFKRLLTELLGEQGTSKILPIENTKEAQPNTGVVLSDQKNLQFTKENLSEQLSLKRWRSAEQQVLLLLQGKGWNVEDVSRQNIGYDIEGMTLQGQDVYIEVKSIDYPGQSFIMTSNEEAVARQKGDAYYLALVYQTNDWLEVAFIKDPVSQLALTRQCRNWVWECTSYNFIPNRLPLT